MPPTARDGLRQNTTETKINDKDSQETAREKCGKNENWYDLEQFCKSFARGSFTMLVAAMAWTRMNPDVVNSVA
jgi:hypothetical protein